MKHCIAAMAFAIPFAIVIGANTPVLAQGPSPVHVDEVISEPMRQTTPVLGRIVARQRGEIAAEVAGAIEAVHVDIGDHVNAGDTLVSLDDSWLDLTLRLREAELAEAASNAESEEASVVMARHALDRIQGLSGTSSYSGARFEDAEEELRQATASRAAANARKARASAELDEAKLAIERSTIKAPYAGVVVERLAQPGAYLNVGSPVATLIDDASMEVEADVPSAQGAEASPGTELQAERANGEEITVTVRAVIPEENPLTRTRAVRFSADFSDAAHSPATGESVTVHMPIAAERQVNTVHKDAVIQQPTGPTVFLVVDGAATIRPIKTGLSVGDRIEVLEGLEPGDIVVVRGNERLQPGQKVSY